MIDFFEFSNEMLCVANDRGYFTRVNQAWTKALGWSVDELTSRPYIDFIHPDDLEATIREAACSCMIATKRYGSRTVTVAATARIAGWRGKAILDPVEPTRGNCP